MKSIWSRYQIVFLEVIENGLSEANSESIKALAFTLWYINFVPEVAIFFELQHVTRACYLLERLTTLHCFKPGVRQSVKEKIKFLKVRANETMQLLPLSYVVNNRQALLEFLSQRWHVNNHSGYIFNLYCLIKQNITNTKEQ